MSAWRDATASAGSRRVPSRYSLAGAVVAALIVLGAAVAAIGTGGANGRRKHTTSAASAHRVASAGSAAATGAAASGSAASSKSAGAGAAQAGSASAHAEAGSTQAGAGAKGAVAEVRDPEEARSYPAPPPVHHRPATSPATAGEQIVAPGAASDAEVRAELSKMHELERASSNVSSLKTVPGGDSIAGNGKLPIPTDVPETIQRVIAGANAIADFPYVYGGGHASFVDSAYDCSGSVSYALAAGGLLSAPETSGQLESWGKPGPGRWITVYANAGHTYMYVNVGGAWMLYDTAGRSGVFASRWQPNPVNNSGYVARHWPGL